MVKYKRFYHKKLFHHDQQRETSDSDDQNTSTKKNYPVHKMNHMNCSNYCMIHPHFWRSNMIIITSLMTIFTQPYVHTTQKKMIGFIRDCIVFPFQTKNQNNKLFGLLQFLIKDYPAYVWTRPSIKKILLLPLLIIYIILKKK